MTCILVSKGNPSRGKTGAKKKGMQAKLIEFVRGKVIHAPSRGEIAIFPDAFLQVDAATGRIVAFHPEIQPTDLVHFNDNATNALVLTPTQFLMPGFIDTHVHAPQYPYVGTGTDTPLMEWLTKYTFPVEQAFEDLKFAQEWYTKLIDRMLSEGITTAQYFATIHLDATKRLVDVIVARGQRALVGLVSMDQHAPESYKSLDAATSLQDAEAFIQYTLNLQNDLVSPVITPRFIPTCSMALLQGLGALAATYDVHVQSHIAESHDEEEFVDSLFPGRRDVEIFDQTGLLTSKSCMAHGVHLREEELELLAARGTSIAHCPLSNFFFANGFLDVQNALNKKVKVGLGTDMAGGYSPSMLRAMQNAVLTFKALEITKKTTQPMDYKDAFWLATMGGAQALGIAHRTGSFAVGKALDATVVEMSTGTIDLFERDTELDQFQKFVHNGDSRNFKSVLVQGKIVYSQD